MAINENGVYMGNTRGNNSSGVLNRSQSIHGKNNADLIKATTYSKQLLKTLIGSDYNGHKNLLSPHMIEKHAGLSLTFTRNDPMGEGQRLDEGITPVGKEFSQSTVSGTLHQYGDLAYATDVSATIMNYDILEQIQKELVTAASRTIDSICRNEIHAQAGMRQLPTIMKYVKGSRMTPEKAATKISEITTEHGFNYWDVHMMTLQLQSSYVASRKSRIRCTFGIFGRDSLLKDPWFVDNLASNGDLSKWNNNDINSFGGIDFEVIDNTKSYQPGDIVVEMPGNEADNTVAAGVQLETAIVSVPGMGIRLDLVSSAAGGNGIKWYRGGFESTKDDPLGQRGYAGYKFWFGVLLHTPQAFGIYYFAKDGGYNGTMSLNVNMLSLRQYAPLSGYISKPDAAGIIARFKAAVTSELQKEFATITPSDYTLGDVLFNGVKLTDATISNGSEGTYGNLEMEITGVGTNFTGKATVYSQLQIKKQNVTPAGQRLFDVIKVTQLGKIEATDVNIIKAVKQKNPIVNDNDLTVISLDEATGEAILGSADFVGSAIVNFIVGESEGK